MTPDSTMLRGLAERVESATGDQPDKTAFKDCGL